MRVYIKIRKNYINLVDRWGEYNFKFIRLFFYLFPLPKVISYYNTSLVVTYLDNLPPRAKMPDQLIVRWLLGWYCYSYNSMPELFYETLTEVNLYRRKFKTTSHIHLYLEYLYGKDWKIPRSFKDYKEQKPHNFIVSKQKLELESE